METIATVMVSHGGVIGIKHARIVIIVLRENFQEAVLIHAQVVMWVNIRVRETVLVATARLVSQGQRNQIQ